MKAAVIYGNPRRGTTWRLTRLMTVILRTDSIPGDTAYWRERGWLDGGRPWRDNPHRPSGGAPLPKGPFAL